MSDVEDLQVIKKKSENKLLTVKTIWPLTLFRDKVVVDENKVTIIYGYPLGRHIFPIPIENINGIHHSEGPLFATLSFELTGYETNPKPVRYLPKAASRSLQKLINGLLTAKKSAVETAKIPEHDLTADAKIIGS